ncbi:MAG: hypothetical protein M1840_006661 [Geoglossum simile]|nr:MAG: hypothetical protein M1840_006661 [Geoglossum simile]
MPAPIEGSKTQALLSTLEEATAQHGRYYDQYLSFNIRFESDNTSAFRDAKRFRDMLQTLGIPVASTELVITDKDVDPRWSVTALVLGVARRVARTMGRTLIIGHYAGHSRVGEGGLEFFAAPGKEQSFRYDSTLQPFCIEDSTFCDADIILILDSHYSGAATRDSPLTTRSVEVVAAVKADSEIIAEIKNDTFTSRLAEMVLQHVRRGDSSISFAELVSELRESNYPDRYPEYWLRTGRVGVRVPVLANVSVPLHYRTLMSPNSLATGHRNSGIRDILRSSSPSASTSNYMALFSVRIGDADASSEEVRKLVEWVHSLDPSIGLEVTNVYPSYPTVIIFYSPWSLWAQLNGLPGFSLICEALGRDKLQGIISLLTDSNPLPNASPLSIETI